MKDFKNENEYGNLKLEDETYEGILLKTGDEGYRYFSSSNSSTSSGGSGGGSGSGSSSNGSGGYNNSPSGSNNNSNNSSNQLGDVIIDRTEVSKGTSGYVLSMHASCVNAWNMCLYVDSIGTSTSTQIFSKGVSASEIDGECTALSGGKTYRVRAVAIPRSGESKTASKYIDTPANLIGETVTIEPHVSYIDFTYNQYNVSLDVSCENAYRMDIVFSGDSSDVSTVVGSRCTKNYTLREGIHNIKVIAYGVTEDGETTTVPGTYVLKLVEGELPSTLFVEVSEDSSGDMETVSMRGSNTMNEPTTMCLKYVSNDSGESSSWESSTHDFSKDVTLKAGTYTFMAITEGHDTKKTIVVRETIKIGKKVGNGKKILLLYAGPGYATYTDADIKKLLKRSGATDFLITTTHKFNYYSKGSSRQIISVNDVNSLSTSIFGSTALTDEQRDKEYAKIRQDMIDEINQIDADYPNAKPCYWDYITLATDLAKAIIQNESDDTQKNVGIWFAIPMMVGSGIAADLYIDVYKQCINDICANCDANRITGFYYAQEAITPWYTRFDETAFDCSQYSSSNYSQVSRNSSMTVENYPFKNVIVRNMMEISAYLHNNFNKQFMWIPYYRDTTSTETGTRVGYIANKTSIFDYIILQPSYFRVSNNVEPQNVETVRKCVENQYCVYRESNGVCEPVGGVTASGGASIGAEMEIESNHTSRYGKYVDEFDILIRNNKPVGFYAGDRNTTMTHSIFKKIEAFFRFGF